MYYDVTLSEALHLPLQLVDHLHSIFGDVSSQTPSSDSVEMGGFVDGQCKPVLMKPSHTAQLLCAAANSLSVVSRHITYNAVIVILCM